MSFDPGTPEERLRKAAAWAHGDDRPLLACACLDGADEIARLRKLLLTGLALHGGEAHTYSEKEWRAEARAALGIRT